MIGVATVTGNFGSRPWPWEDNGDGTYTPHVFNTGAGGSGGGDGAIVDGVDPDISATVVDGATANPLLVSLTDQNGDPVAVGGGTQYAEDTASAANEMLTMAGVVCKDAAATMVGADGDRTALQVDSSGQLRVVLPAGGSGLTDAELRATPVPVSGTVTASDGGGSLTVDGTVAVTHAALTELAGAIDTEMQVDVVAALPAGNNNIGDVDVASIAAGDNNIGNVDIVTVPAPLSTTGGGTEATALRVTVANDSTGVLSVDDNGGSLTVDGSVSLAAAIPAGTNNIGDVDVLSLPALPAGTNNIGDVDVLTLPALVAGSANIGDVDIASFAAGAITEVQGDVAQDAAVAGNPVLVGGRASDAVPTEMSADGDSVFQWLLRNGASMVANAPHLGMIADPYTLTSKTVQQTTAQTGTDVVTPTSGKRLVVTSYQIQAGGTTAATVQLWFGANADTTYTRGTDLAIFDGEFAPSATLKPGVTQNGLWIASAVDHEIHLTTSAGITITITVWYYEV